MTFIYDDKLRPLLKAGKSDCNRVSHVEPTTIEGEVKWTADMAPVGGPELGPFDGREEALDEEVKWLMENRLGMSCPLEK